jgi:cytidyltransferase-like protein
MTHRRILIMGLPGAGKTTLARLLAARLGAVHFDADQVRANVNRDLGFSLADRIEQARRMAWLCDTVVAAGQRAIADFVCPTAATREAFGPAYTVWVDRIRASRFPDTDSLFQPPGQFHLRVTAEGPPEAWVERILRDLVPVFDPTAPTALFVGRYQPFHAGHRALIEEGVRRVGQACVAVRDTPRDEGNPLPFEEVRARIELALEDLRGAGAGHPPAKHHPHPVRARRRLRDRADRAAAGAGGGVRHRPAGGAAADRLIVRAAGGQWPRPTCSSSAPRVRAPPACSTRWPGIRTCSPVR